MAVAYVIQTYKDLDQVERLAQTIAKGARDATVVVSHHGTDLDRKRLETSPAIDRVLPSAGGRGRFSVIDGLMSAMRWLEKRPQPFDWLVVLSGQDYPIRPVSELEAELAGSEYDGYFHHFEALNEADALAPPMSWSRQEVEDRYLFDYAVLKEQPTTLDRALLKIPRLLSERTRGYRLHTGFGIMLGNRVSEAPFTRDFKLYGGSYWMTINRKAVQSILGFVDEHPDIVQYFRSVIVPEEAFLQTVLANDPALHLSSHELRYYEFGQRHGHPLDFTMGDLPRVLDSGCYFARKFDMRRHPDVLDAIDAHLEANGTPVEDQSINPVSSETPLLNAS